MDYGYNQYNTGYGGQGGADGGGFIAGDTSSSPAGGKGGYGKDTLRPVTIKQLLEAEQPHPDANFKVDGEPLTEVTVVAQLRNVSKQPTSITYKVDDGTGSIELKLWLGNDTANIDSMDDSETPKHSSKLVEDTYCRVWGRLKSFGNKRQVVVDVIRPISDNNEVNYHLLEATAVHLYFTRGPPDAQTNGQKTNTAENGMDTSGGDTADKSLPPMSPLARRMLAALRNVESHEGLHVQYLATNLGANTNDVYKASEELLSHALIFTTIDDNTWAIL